MTKLKSCPFCGSKDVFRGEGRIFFKMVLCHKCMAEGPVGITTGAATRLWNKRSKI